MSARPMLGRAAAAGLFALAAGCVPTSSVAPIDSFDALGPDELVLVGSVELDPPLAPDEQKLGRYEEYRDVAMLILDDAPRPVDSLALGDMKRRIDAKFRKTFFVRLPQQPFFIVKGWVFLDTEIKVVGPNATTEAYQAPLQGVLRVDVKPGDRAVYIGTIRYQRDEFFGTKATVRDDYAKANAEFKKKFGAQHTLRKSLAVRLKASD
jgi:hypothetical protein